MRVSSDTRSYHAGGVLRRDERHRLDTPEVPRHHFSRRDTRHWCAGKVGRRHAFVLERTLDLFGLKPLSIWACTRCGRKAYNLKPSIDAS